MPERLTPEYLNYKIKTFERAYQKNLQNISFFKEILKVMENDKDGPAPAAEDTGDHLKKELKKLREQNKKIRKTIAEVEQSWKEWFGESSRPDGEAEALAKRDVRKMYERALGTKFHLNKLFVLIRQEIGILVELQEELKQEVLRLNRQGKKPVEIIEETSRKFGDKMFSQEEKIAQLKDLIREAGGFVGD